MTIRHPSRHAFAPALIATLFAFACGDPTGPPEPLVVTLTGSTTFGPVLTAEGEEPSIRCGFRMIASATGPGKADWQGVVFRFYAGADRSAPLDTSALTEEEIRGAWSRDSISRALTDTTEWYFNGPIPFEVEFAFAYQQRGATSPSFATARGVCGPTPMAGAAPPTTSLVQVRTSDDQLDVGDSIFVTFAANSASGLWRSGVSVSGPFEQTRWQADTLRNDALHTIVFVVPQVARLDLPVSLLLLADDIALERSTSLHTSGIRVVDRTPPRAGGYTTQARLATGSAFSFMVSADDNNAVRTLVWELDGEISASDSITLIQPLAAVSREIVLTARPEWAGKRARLRVRSYDDAGLRSAEWFSADGIFNFIQSFVAPSASFAFETQGLPDFHAFDPVHGRFYGSYSGGGRIVGVALTAMVPLPPISLPGAGAIGVSPSGDSLFVGTRTSRTIRILSPSSGASFGTIALSSLESLLPAGTSPSAAPDWIAPLLGGRVLVHVSSVPGVVEIDLAAGTQRYRPEFEPVAVGLSGFVATDRQRVLLISPNCHRWYLAISDSLTPCRPGTGVDPRFVSLPLSGDGAGLGERVVDETLTPLGPPDVQGMSIPDADRIHHWNADMWDGRIYKVRSSDGTILKSTSLAGQAWFLRFLADGRSLIVLGWGTLTKYDLGGQ
jgi:hypothetical protein